MAYIESLQLEVPIVETFNNVTSTSISYPPAVQEILGRYPIVQVWYFDKVTGEYVLSNLPSSRIEFKKDKIFIYHGGVESGIIKVF